MRSFLDEYNGFKSNIAIHTFDFEAAVRSFRECAVTCISWNDLREPLIQVWNAMMMEARLFIDSWIKKTAAVTFIGRDPDAEKAKCTSRLLFMVLRAEAESIAEQLLRFVPKLSRYLMCPGDFRLLPGAIEPARKISNLSSEKKMMDLAASIFKESVRIVRGQSCADEALLALNLPF